MLVFLVIAQRCVKPTPATEHTPTLRAIVASFCPAVSSNTGYRFSITAIIIFLIKKDMLERIKKSPNSKHFSSLKNSIPF
jgi:hypothetical protein